MTYRTDKLPAGVVASAPCRVPRRFAGRPATVSPPDPRTPRYRLEFDDGSLLTVRGGGLIGRDPAGPAGDNVEHLVALVDHTLSLSRTHLEFGIAESKLWVRDCNSTNGSQLEVNGSRTSITPGLRVDAPAECTIHMGAIKVKVHPITGRGRIGGATVDWGVATRVGPVHARNQDAYCTAPPLFVVADGMGGHSAGDLASRAAIEALSPLIDREPVTGVMLDACLADARARIGRISADNELPPGTTLSGVIVTVLDGALFWMVVNIGDSRTYRLNSAGLRQVSIDHSVVRELTDAGAITASTAGSLPIRNILTRALIAGADYPPDVWLLPMVSGDRILVCSDGLTGRVDDEYIENVLRTTAEPQMAADELVNAAVDAYGRDDITALVIDAVTVGAPSASGSA